jgi:hypothetical protein
MDWSAIGARVELDGSAQMNGLGVAFAEGGMVPKWFPVLPCGSSIADATRGRRQSISADSLRADPSG